MSRRVIPFPEGFFNDGYWYVLTSPGLGGMGAAALEEALLPEQDPDAKRDLMRRGVCLPLFFDGDCALDRAAVVVGELSEVEEREWVGRLVGHLDLGSGALLVVGGGTEDDFEEAQGEQAAQDPQDLRACRIEVAPGRYRVEVYAFVGSMSVDQAWGEDLSASGVEAAFARPLEIAAYWDATRPGEERPDWLAQLVEEGYVDAEEHGLLECLIRLVPSEEPLEPPPLVEGIGWAGVFELRRPEQAPRGIARATLSS